MATFVKKQSGQTEDQLIAQFRKKVLEEEIVEEASRRAFHTTPSAVRHEKLKNLRRKRKKGPKGTA